MSLRAPTPAPLIDYDFGDDSLPYFETPLAYDAPITATPSSEEEEDTTLMAVELTPLPTTTTTTTTSAATAAVVASSSSSSSGGAAAFRDTALTRAVDEALAAVAKRLDEGAAPRGGGCHVVRETDTLWSLTTSCSFAVLVDFVLAEDRAAVDVVMHLPRAQSAAPVRLTAPTLPAAPGKAPGLKGCNAREGFERALVALLSA